MFVGQAKPFAGSVDKFRTGFSMRFISPRNLGDSFPYQAVRDDELRPAVVVLFRIVERVEKRLHVFLVDFLNVKAVSLKTRAGVFALSCGCRRVERYRVAVVNQNQIIETEVSRESTCLRRDASLHATVTRQANHMLIENPVVGGVETSRRHFARHRDADRVTDTLAEWPGRAFDARRIAKFRMARRPGMQLPKTFNLRHWQIVTAHL